MLVKHASGRCAVAGAVADTDSVRLRAALITGAALATIGLFSAGAGAHPARLRDMAIVHATERLLHDSIAALSTRSGPADQQYFAGGVWHSADSSCWYCQVGPGTAAAVMWRASGGRNARLRQLALVTFDTAIADHRNGNGSFGAPADSPDIESMMFGVELGTALVELRPTLGQRRLRRWTAALSGAANYLIENGNLRWYTNGNINLGNTELFYLAWRVTRKARFKAAYNQSWRFTLDPPQGRWPGFGLRLLPPTSVIASGAKVVGRAGYLAESGGSAPGFDPEYTELQLDVATRLYVLSDDPRALRLANLLVNALLTRFDPSDWMINGSNGSRHPGRHVTPLTTPALAVLTMDGKRPDLAKLAVRQFAVINSTYRGDWTYSNVGYYRGYGNEVSVILLAAQQLHPRRVAAGYAATGL